MNKILLTAPLALAAAAVLATPASAASWNSPGQIRAEIAQLDRQIDRTRGLSQREEQQLERQVDRLGALYNTYARYGFNRAELNVLSTRVEQLRTQLARYANDRDNRYGRGDRDRYDRDGRYDRHDDRDDRNDRRYR